MEMKSQLFAVQHYAKLKISKLYNETLASFSD